MPDASDHSRQLSRLHERLAANVGRVVLGQDDVVRKLVAVLIAGVAQIQIVQERLDQFCFRIVPDENFGAASREQIRQLVAERFGGDARFEIELVERIPQEPSGKYRFCISKVENPFTQPLQPVTS